MHPYCSRTCGAQAKAGNHPPALGGAAAPYQQVARTAPMDQWPWRKSKPREIRFYEQTADFYEFTNFWVRPPIPVRIGALLPYVLLQSARGLTLG